MRKNGVSSAGSPTGSNTRGDAMKIKTADLIGPTPLIAAMRCVVAVNLGDEVDVPDELV